ncbi:YgjV family protein [Gilliamella sp. W8129]|nr:YgjV family protein [Gilliamella sp. W8123]MBI0118692.1 YgjV family protein [Gilliamella sp. W8129]MBI0156990.1 YgjV family protein [Gilliamella sp. M0364]
MDVEQHNIRLLILLSSILWIIYSLWIGSLDSLAIEVTFTIITIMTIIKLSPKSTV